MDTHFLRQAILLLLCGLLPLTAFAAEPGIVINEDDSHFFASRTADDMTLAGLNAFVDQYAGTKLSHLFLCPNAMRASFKSYTIVTIRA